MCYYEEYVCPKCYDTFEARRVGLCDHPGEPDQGCTRKVTNSHREECKKCLSKSDVGAYYRGQAYGPGQTEETRAKVKEYLANRSQEDKDKEAAEREATIAEAKRQARIARGLPPEKPEDKKP